MDVNVTVEFSTADDSATTAGNDYTGITSQVVTFLAGTTTAQIVNVTVNNDNVVEDDEVFEVSLANLSAGGRNVSLGTSTGTGAIQNNDSATLTLSGGIAQNETNSGQISYVFTATLSAAVQGGFQVAYTTSDGTATTADNDYDDNDGTLTFAGTSGETKTFTVLVNGDTAVENDETFLAALGGITLTSAEQIASITIVDSPQTATITNDDASVEIISVSPSEVDENSGAGMVFTFERTGATSGVLVVSFDVTGAAKLADSDYTFAFSDGGALTDSAGTITFAAGSSTATLIITPTGDTTGEPDETVTLTLTSGAGYLIGSDASQTATILNDDTNVSVSVSAPSVAENGVVALVYTFTINATQPTPLTVSFDVGGTALFNATAALSDYTVASSDAFTFTATGGAIVIDANQPTATLTLTLVNDTVVEGTEDVLITVVNGAGYGPGTPASASADITDNDTAVIRLASASSSVDEDALPGTHDVVVELEITGNGVVGAGTLGVALGVNVARLSGSASPANDFTFTDPTSVTFNAGDDSTATRSATITLINDNRVEGDEDIVLELNTLTGGGGQAIIDDSNKDHTVTIVDDDTATISFATSNGNAAETTTPHPVTVTLTIAGGGTLERTVSVDVVDLLTAGGADTADYSFTNTTLTFNSGSASGAQTVDVVIVNDATSEGSETLDLGLQSLIDGTNGQVTLLAPTTHQVTIVDNDVDLQVTVGASIDPVSAGSGTGNLVHVVTVTNVGLTDATGIEIDASSAFPATGVTLDSVTPSAGSFLSGDWSLGSLAIGASATLTFVFTVAASAAPGTDVLSVSASLDSVAEQDINAGNDADDELTSIVRVADLQITKTDGLANALPGQVITYTIIVTNAGPSDVAGAAIVDNFPAQLTNVTYTSSFTGTVTGQSGGGGPAAGDINDVVDMTVGSTLTYVVTGTVVAGASGLMQNTASVTPPADTQDANTANNSATDSTSINSPPVVDDQQFTIREFSPNGAVVGSVAASDPDAGQSLTYSITAGNVSGAFTIDAGTGQIRVANSARLDFASTPTFVLTVTVSDDGGIPLSDTAQITIQLEDVPTLAASLAANQAFTIVGATGSPTQILSVKIFDNSGNLVSAVTPFNHLTALRVATGDFDGNGLDDDFAVLGRRTGIDNRAEIVTYHLSDTGQATETGRFFAFAPDILGNGFIAAGDFDGDGDDDLAVASIGGGRSVVTLQVHVNNGSGSFAIGGSTSIDFGVISAPRIGAGNTDGDAFDEIVVAARTATGARVLVFDAEAGVPFQQGTGFTWDFGISGYSRGAFVAVGEFDPTSTGEEIVLGSNVGGGGRVDIVHFDGASTATLVENGRLTPFGADYDAAVRVATGRLDDRVVLVAGHDRFQAGQYMILAREANTSETNPPFEEIPAITALTTDDGLAPATSPNGNRTLGSFVSFANLTLPNGVTSLLAPSVPGADLLDGDPDDIDLALAVFDERTQVDQDELDDLFSQP